MRKIAALLISLLITANLLANDEVKTKSKPIELHPYFELGSSFLNNSILKDAYQRNSAFNFGLGVQFGDIHKLTVVPFAGFNRIKCTNIFEKNENVQQDSVLKINQINLGLYIQLLKKENLIIKTKTGFTSNYIREDFSGVSTDMNKIGFILGIGIEKLLIERKRIFFDLNYNYLKNSDELIKNFDTVSLNFGFGF